MRTTEHPHNTDAQVQDYLQAALALVADLEPPDDLRQVAFAKAVDLFAAKQIVFEQPAPLVGMPNLRPQ
jgi:hypothetical protein